MAKLGNKNNVLNANDIPPNFVSLKEAIGITGFSICMLSQKRDRIKNLPAVHRHKGQCFFLRDEIEYFAKNSVKRTHKKRAIHDLNWHPNIFLDCGFSFKDQLAILAGKFYLLDNPDV